MRRVEKWPCSSHLPTSRISIKSKLNVVCLCFSCNNQENDGENDDDDRSSGSGSNDEDEEVEMDGKQQSGNASMANFSDDGEMDEAEQEPANPVVTMKATILDDPSVFPRVPTGSPTVMC